MEKKKKPTNYIIPATFFTSLSPAIKQIEKPNLKYTAPTHQPEKIEVTNEVQEKAPVLKNVVTRKSKLTLKSVFDKEKEKKTIAEENYDNHPKDVFSQIKLIEVWKEYHQQLIKKGEQNLASIINSNEPKLGENFAVEFFLPNQLMADKMHRGTPTLLGFLRESLNNYGIIINVTVDKTVTKKFAYTPQEKFDKLKEINPALIKLKDVFKLDL